MPENEAFKHKECDNAEEDIRADHNRLAFFHDLGKDVDEYIAEQRADGKADKVRQYLLQSVLLYRKGTYSNERDDAHDADTHESIKPGKRHTEELAAVCARDV